MVSLGCALKVERGREGRRWRKVRLDGVRIVAVDNLIDIPRRDSKRKQNYECLFSSHST